MTYLALVIVVAFDGYLRCQLAELSQVYKFDNPTRAISNLCAKRALESLTRS